MSDWIINFLAILPAIIIAISFHEYAHAKVAIKLGDPTPKLQGRDTISPVSHIDPIGFICLIIAHFGWGRPVQIDPRNFKNPLKGQMLVSLAGPLMNLLIAFVTLIIINIIDATGIMIGLSDTIASAISLIVTYIVLINISLCVFNLLPLPNFDGSKILLYFLPAKAKFKYLELEKYGPVIFLIIVLTPIPELVISPILNWILAGMQFIISLPINLLGL